MRLLLAIAATVVMAASTLVAAPAVAVAAAPTPVVSGNHLVDSRTGQVWVPHGVNYPSFGYACAQGWGYSSDDATDAAASAMASWHIDTVRLPLNQNCWLGLDGAPAYGDVAGYRAAVGAWVATLHAAGLAVILDLHYNPPVGHADDDGQWAMADSRSPAFWSSVAGQFAGDPSVIFDLFNEPYSIGWGCWRDGGCQVPVESDTSNSFGGSTFTATGMSALLSAVRTAGAAQPVMLGGIDYSNDLTGWLANRPADNQLVASWHNYPGQRCDTVSCWNAEIAAVAAQVPVVAGEFGQTDGGSGFLTTFMTWADAAGVGYAPWAWWNVPGTDSTNGLYSLYTGSNFAPKAPSGVALFNHLATQAGTPLVTTPPRDTKPFGKLRLAKHKRSITVTGWAIDREAKKPVRITVRIDGHSTRTLTASRTRSDIPKKYRSFGKHHGYSTTYAHLKRGKHRVCVWATNQGNTSTKTQISCQTVTLK